MTRHALSQPDAHESRVSSSCSVALRPGSASSRRPSSLSASAIQFRIERRIADHPAQRLDDLLTWNWAAAEAKRVDQAA